jgi:formate-dependent nitrite reductase cytochrome c552 subunit
MSQVFHRSANYWSRASIVGISLLLGFLAVAVVSIAWCGYTTGQSVTVDQPVQFSHAHHVGSMGIDCRYCHTSVEESAFANIPPTKTCMNCHSQIWTNAPILEPVRASFRENRPLTWWRVHDLPDFVYFNHSIHVAKGVGCATCHGPVDRMPLLLQEHSLQMSWCLNCHRNPAKYVRPKEEVFNMEWQPPSNDPGLGERLVKEYKIADVRQLTSCSTCHR